MCWFQGVYVVTKVLLRNYPKIGHVTVELIASMSWRIRLCDHSCPPSRHHPNEESWKESTHKAHKMYRGIKRSLGMVSIVIYALCTNPWSLWEFFVGLGCGVQVQVKHHERDQMLEACRTLWWQWTCEDVAVCKFKWSIMKRSNAWSLPSIVVTMDLWRCAEEWLTHSGVWGSNQLVFIEPTQPRKVVQLEGVKIVII